MRPVRWTFVRAAALVPFFAWTSFAAQDFNVDVGILGTVPSSSYAAAGQAGVWQEIPAALPSTSFALVDTSGAASSVTASYTGGFDYDVDNPNTTGDDEALLDDVQDIGYVGSTCIWTFSGLAAGEYEVLTYAWAPDDPLGYLTDVAVAGAIQPSQTVGGVDWSGAHALGATYARHCVTVASGGTLDVTLTTNAGFGSLGGIQLRLGPCSCGVLGNYCTAKVNSQGCTPAMSSSGTPSASAGSGFLLEAQNVLPSKAGILFYSTVGPGGAPFQGGFLCATQPIRRTPLSTASSGPPPCSGTYSFDFNVRIASGVDANLVAGQQVWSQYWTRDGAVFSGTGLTDGYTFFICP